MTPLRRLLATAAATALAAAIATTAPAAPASAEGTILGAGAPDAVTGSYIAVLRDTPRTTGAVPATAANLAHRYGGTIARVYTTALHGFAVNLPETAARRLAADPDIAYVEADRTTTITGTQTPTPSWGLDRVDQHTLPLDNAYTYGNTGAGVKAYVIDTGINLTHTDFGGRAISGIDTIDNDNDATDCHGHGTHVAGILGGTTYGVAKGVTLVAVRVMGCTGNGTIAGIIAGIDWATADHPAGAPAVANISISGSTSKTLDAAVTRSIADGISYSVAAGNLFGSDACGNSPGRTPDAITVASTTNTDTRTPSSNIGKCVDIFAPGDAITSDWIGSDTATRTIGGTSMASPHAAGAAALLYAADPGLTALQIRDKLVNNATPGVVANPGTGSPNRLLYTS